MQFIDNITEEIVSGVTSYNIEGEGMAWYLMACYMR